MTPDSGRKSFSDRLLSSRVCQLIALIELVHDIIVLTLTMVLLFYQFWEYQYGPDAKVYAYFKQETNFALIVWRSLVLAAATVLFIGVKSKKSLYFLPYLICQPIQVSVYTWGVLTVAIATIHTRDQKDPVSWILLTVHAALLVLTTIFFVVILARSLKFQLIDKGDREEAVSD